MFSRLKTKTQEAIAGYVLVLPTLVFYFVLVIVPIFVAFGLSFTEYEIIKQPEFVGLDNYLHVFSDVRLPNIFGNSLKFMVMSVIGNVGVGLLLAVLLNRKVPKFINYIFRFSFFLPVIIAYSYVALIWAALFSTDTGFINYYLGELGLGKVGWLTDKSVVMYSIIIMDIWKNCGFYMVIFLAGLQNVPGEILEAAMIDGANSRQSFFRITLPMISPTMFFNVIWCSIGALQVFDSVSILTTGGPGDASRTLVLYIYENAFKKFDMGYASAMSIVLLIFIATLTALQFALSKKWVYE